jgi:hypothetical protein
MIVNTLEIVADSGYGSDQNYDYMKSKWIGNYLKFSYLHKEQKKPFKNNPFLTDNLFYNPEGDFFVYQMGQKKELISRGQRLSERGPMIRETLIIVRPIVESGNAIALMGYHEYNALCFHH